MIVVDTNVVAWLFMPSDRTDDARALLRRDPDWKVPLLWRSEFRNVLAVAHRAGRCDLATAMRRAREAEELLTGAEYAVESEGVLRLVAASTCSAYDCEFVALADDLGVPLVTGDRRLQRDFPDVAWSPERFLGGA